MSKSKMQQAREFAEQFKEDFFNNKLEKKTLTDGLVNQLGFPRNTARRYSKELASEWAAEKSTINLSEFVEPRPPKKRSKSDDVRELVVMFMKDYLEGQVSRGELKELISAEIGVAQTTVGHCITEEKKKWLAKYPKQSIKRAFPKRKKDTKRGRNTNKFAIAENIAKRYMPMYHDGSLSQGAVVRLFKTGCPCVEATAQRYFENLKNKYKSPPTSTPTQVSGLCCQHCGKPPFPDSVRFQLLPASK